MPLFTYVCKSCKAEFDVKQLFYDEPLVQCGSHCKLEDFASGNILGEGKVVRKNSKKVKLKSNESRIDR